MTFYNLDLEGNFNEEISVPSNTKILLDGENGDSYLIYNSTLDQMEIWKGGVLQVSW